MHMDRNGDFGLSYLVMRAHILVHIHRKRALKTNVFNSKPSLLEPDSSNLYVYNRRINKVRAQTGFLAFYKR